MAATAAAASSATFALGRSSSGVSQLRPARGSSPLLIAGKRKSARISATLLTEKPNSPAPASQEPESLPGNEEQQEEARLASSSSSSSSDKPESWIIRVEQGFNLFATDFVIAILDRLYADRDYARFYVLETIARVPYFAFVSVLHMYESFGWWRRADYLKVHFAESWNELHHLLVMEALGGDERWFDRFLAQHIAVAYYFLTSLMYTISPRMAYHFSECVEKHAFSTYDKFIKAHGEELKKLPAPQVAVDYYTKGDLYMFDEFQTDRLPETRRPRVDNLYDVFVNIREDEWEHCKTMKACQVRGNLHSPHSTKLKDLPDEAQDEKEDEEDEEEVAECAGIVECAITATSHAERVRKKSTALLKQ
ncbi:ubiquinol oxidase 4, chloroplastic/chromoplastic [Selaginella moellendorffii]|nr:ubiquinol oxidase 4, chloroplastic/chromoplastic [Selaginella moellendorffii]|eukprot:XP_002987450.2 ubiquinol oxidase 4, chloroplastic/chromoplastic [Selaginella moellendorffii]